MGSVFIVIIVIGFIVYYINKKILGVGSIWRSFHSQNEYSSQKTQRKRKKIAESEIMKRKFSKDQGEYVDYVEEEKKIDKH